VPSSPFLPKLAAESPAAGRRYDPELADLLERHLERREEDGSAGYHVSFRDYLFTVVEEGFPYYSDREDRRFRGHAGRAVDYLSGRVYWQLGFEKRRPPRGWREGLGSRSLTYPELSVYPALDEIGRRVVDFCSLLAIFYDPALEAGDFVHGWRSQARLKAALLELKASLLPKARLRLSGLAA